jgi:hypothetical protein
LTWRAHQLHRLWWVRPPPSIWSTATQILVAGERPSVRDSEEIRSELAALKPRLQEEYPIQELGVFGSYARGEQRPDSDLDVLVTSAQPVTLFELVRLEDELTEQLGVTVDVVTGDSLQPRIASPRMSSTFD